MVRLPLLSALCAAAALVSTPASAQHVQGCYDPDGLQPLITFLIEPWEQNRILLDQGTMQVIALDTIEPSASAFYLYVTTVDTQEPITDHLLGVQCILVGAAPYTGFSGMDMANAVIDRRGEALRVTVPVATTQDYITFDQTTVTLSFYPETELLTVGLGSSGVAQPVQYDETSGQFSLGPAVGGAPPPTNNASPAGKYGQNQ